MARPHTTLHLERVRLGFNQTEAAHEVHIPLREYALIEAGRLQPTDHQLERLGAVFQMWPPSLLLRPVLEENAEPAVEANV